MTKVIFILSVTSDIGTGLAKRYSNMGNTVIGTYRSTNNLDNLNKMPNTHLFYCDLEDKVSIDALMENYKESGLSWDTFISCPCNPLPLESFFDGEFEEWNKSMHTNAIEQLRVLHGLYPLRNKDKISNVVYFSGGGGSNKAVKKFSAYNLAKITLTKMCELLDAENEDLNTFIIGPGWVKTKTHDLILKHTDSADERHIATKKFLESKEGTRIDDIFNCIEWLCQQGREISGGRNFSVVYDKWGNEKLAEILKSNSDMYKLRRLGNETKVD